MERVLIIFALTTSLVASSTFGAQEVIHPELTHQMNSGSDSISVVIFFDPSGRTANHQDQSTQISNKTSNRSSYARELANSDHEELNSVANLLAQDHQIEQFWITPAISVTLSTSEIEQLAYHPGVISIVPDAELSLVDPITIAPASSAVSTSVATELNLLGVPSVWAQGVTGKGRLVCSFDTGVKWDHPGLQSKWRGLTQTLSSSWFSSLVPDSMPYDRAGHGTHTMGIMVGSTPTDSFGVAPGASWISGAVIDQGKSLSATISDILAAFQWALNPDGDWSTSSDVPDVILNSWGIPAGLFGPCDNTFWNAIDNVEAAGIVTIFAAGNEGPNPSTVRSPADRGTTPTNSLAVGAVDANKVIANFSSRGPSNCSGAIKPDLAAPGVMIRSSFKDGGYVFMSGTSMAAPYVAGLVALGREVAPNATVDEIKQALLDACDDLGPLGDDNAYGHGLVNAVRFIEILRFQNSRAVELLEASINDTLLLPGETAEITLHVRTASDEEFLQARVIPGQSGIENIQTGLITLFASPSAYTYASVDPLVLSVSSQAAHGNVIKLSVEISDAQEALDTIEIDLPIGYFFAGSSRSIASGELSINLSDFGRFGLAPGSSFNRSGSGMTIGNSANLLYEGALAVTAGQRLVSATRDSLGRVGLPGFAVSVPLAENSAETKIAQSLVATMVPRHAELPLQVRQEVRTPQDPTLNAVAFRMVLTNLADSTLPAAAIGMVFDIDYANGEEGISTIGRGFGLVAQNGLSTGISPLNSSTAVEILSSPTNKQGWLSGTLDSILSPSDSSITTSIGDLLFVVRGSRQELAAGDSIVLEFVLYGSANATEFETEAEQAHAWGASLRVNDSQALPESFQLDQNYPNPFNPTTTIKFGLASPGEVSIEVFNLLGQMVNKIADRQSYPAGSHEILWNARGDHGETLGSGIYFLRVTVGVNSQSRKMVLVK